MALRSPDLHVLTDVLTAIHYPPAISGKSSLLLLLLRLLDPIPSNSHNIIIDNIHLHSIDRAILRQRIIAVPQDVVFLPASSTFRENLDPFGLCTETECRSVLDSVGLWRLVEDNGGLGAASKSDALSLGQKQLFSLSRAVLRKVARTRLGNNSEDRGAETESGLELATVPRSQTTDSSGLGGILFLDEVNSGIDAETERVMFDVIWRAFADYTIIMISHKLDVVVERFDRVIVLDSGVLQEDGDPKMLLQKEQGSFKELWAASGK